MPGYVIAQRTQDEITSPIAVANPPKSAISAPAALTPRNFSRATIDIVKMPSGTAEPNWRKAHSKVPPCRWSGEIRHSAKCCDRYQTGKKEHNENGRYDSGVWTSKAGWGF